jgi:outer membrane protein
VGTNAAAFLLQEIQLLQQVLNRPVSVSPLVNAQGGPNENLIGGYGRTLRNLIGGETRNVTIGVSISLPFKNKTAEANLAGARIQKEQLAASTRSQEQIIEADVRNSAQAVESARQRVLSAREARANAELQLEGEQRLHQVGRSTTFLLFQRENALANARASELRAETDYNKALADLQRATSTTLRANNVIVDSPTAP